MITFAMCSTLCMDLKNQLYFLARVDHSIYLVVKEKQHMVELTDHSKLALHYKTRSCRVVLFYEMRCSV